MSPSRKRQILRAAKVCQRARAVAKGEIAILAYRKANKSSGDLANKKINAVRSKRVSSSDCVYYLAGLAIKFFYKAAMAAISARGLAGNFND